MMTRIFMPIRGTRRVTIGSGLREIGERAVHTSHECPNRTDKVY